MLAPEGRKGGALSGQIVICADDYAISDGTSAVIIELLDEGAINATTCLVETESWPRMAEPLRALCERKPGLGVGLHLNLTERFGASEPALVRPLGHWLRAAFRPAPRGAVEAVLQAFRAQWGHFLRHFGRAPDFLDGHQHVQLYGPARPALLRLTMETGFSGWIRQSGTSGGRLTAQRILMDPLSGALARQARAMGLSVNPAFGGLRSFRRGEDLARIWAADLAGLKEGGLLIVHPGCEGSPPGTEAIDSCRLDEAALLRAGLMQKLLGAQGLVMAPDARRPAWGRPAPSGALRNAAMSG
jgi:predicted glycoside hydrolase/deacetylase ChbG (UPF0249 family)